LAVAFAAVAALAFATAWQSSWAAGASGTPASSALNAAITASKQFEQIPTKFPITTPTAKPIPTGKKIDYIYCGSPGCNTIGTAVQKESALLGWKFTQIPTNGTPASVQSGWQTAVRGRPNAVVGNAFNVNLFQASALQLKSMGAFVGNQGVTDTEPPSTGVTFSLGSGNIGKVGTELAAWVVKDTKGKANTLFVGVPTYAVLAPVATEFLSAYRKWCPGCGLTTLDLPLTSLGTTSVPMIISALRAHPSINYVALALDGADIGLPAALKAAGLTNIKFAGTFGTQVNLSYIQAGEQSATIEENYWEGMAILVDAGARYLTHQSLAPDKKANFQYWIVNRSNLTPNSAGAGPTAPGFLGQLKKIWGKH
jgi:ribose transport system substrate-binding protein